MKKEQLEIVIHTRTQFADKCICDDLFISYLMMHTCITDRQKIVLQGISEITSRNDRLIDIMKRRSIRDFNKMLTCLRETNQLHVEALLSKEGGKKY